MTPTATPDAAGKKDAGRKNGALSRDTVVAAAVAILDAQGERGLTFRALSTRLNTGAGAIYWYVANRNELLDLGCDGVLAEASFPKPTAKAEPLEAIRATALALFDTLDRHPWVGTHLPNSPGLPGLLRILDRIGQQLDRAEVSADRQFYTATAIINYVLGVAAQMSRAAESTGAGVSQAERLAEISARWTQLDAVDFPFIHRVAAEFRTHDDREQFIAGLDLILAGIQHNPS